MYAFDFILALNTSMPISYTTQLNPNPLKLNSHILLLRLQLSFSRYNSLRGRKELCVVWFWCCQVFLFTIRFSTYFFILWILRVVQSNIFGCEILYRQIQDVRRLILSLCLGQIKLVEGIMSIVIKYFIKYTNIGSKSSSSYQT